MYQPGAAAYTNHLAQFGHPSTNGYKDVINAWNPTNYNPAALAQSYHDAGARFVLVQGVHHDNFDNWNSIYNPWNEMNFGPRARHPARNGKTRCTRWECTTVWPFTTNTVGGFM